MPCWTFLPAKGDLEEFASSRGLANCLFQTWRNMFQVLQNSNPGFTDKFIREVIVNYRPSTESPFKVTAPGDAVQFIRDVLPDNSREHFVALYLDGANQVASFSVISTGTANSSLVHPREVFQRAVLVGARAFIVAHNHPSGSLTPSREDLDITQRLSKAGELMGITLIDSLIVTAAGAHSVLNNESF